MMGSIVGVTTQRGRWMHVADTICGVLLLLFAFLFIKHFVDVLKPVGLQEDAMIGLRHFRNLVDHGRLVYNTQTTVMGATDPFFWLIGGAVYSLIRLFGLAMDPVYFTYNFVWTLGLASCLCWLGLVGRDRRLALSALLVTGMALLVMPFRFMWLGLEGPFIMASICIIALTARSNKQWLPFVAAGFLAWNRPEIAVVGALALGVNIVLALPARMWISSGLAALGGWVVPPLALKVTTGQWVPNTVLAKAYFGTDSGAILREPIGFLTQRFEYLDSFMTLGKGASVVLFLTTIGVAIWRLGVAWRRRPIGLFSWRSAFATFTAGYGCFIVSVPNVWEWYISFWLAFALIVVVQAVMDVIFAAPIASEYPVQVSMLLLVVALCVAHAQSGTARYMRTVTTGWLTQERGFRGRLGEELGSRWHAQSVWMEAVGWQGYYNDARVFDEVGLVDRSVFSFAENSGCHYFVDAIRALKPQFIVKRAFEVERNVMLTSPKSCPSAPLFADEASRVWFNENYEVVERYNSQLPEYFGPFSHLLLFRRIDRSH